MGALYKPCCGFDGSPVQALLWFWLEPCTSLVMVLLGALYEPYGFDGSPVHTLLRFWWEPCTNLVIVLMGALYKPCYSIDGRGGSAALQEGRLVLRFPSCKFGFLCLSFPLLSAFTVGGAAQLCTPSTSSAWHVCQVWWGSPVIFFCFFFMSSHNFWKFCTQKCQGTCL